MEKLFSEFKPVSPEEWKAKIIKDLKGIDFEQLRWQTPNGFTVNPFYTSEDLSETKAPLFAHSDWDICEQIAVMDEKKANARALKALEGGASGLVFYIPKKIDTKVLLNNISLEHIYSHFCVSTSALHVLDDLKEAYGKKNSFDGKVKCFVTVDPLCNLAFYGGWENSAEKDMEVLSRLSHIPVTAGVYLEAGATTVNELAISLAHLNEYLNYHSEKGSLKDKVIHFICSVGSDFFTEIAKFRALRRLTALLQEQYGIQFPVYIYTQTALLDKSGLDAYNNMLRTTTEAMSAVIGGCDALSVLPFNEGIEDVTDFSARIARNQQHILKEESYLSKVADIAAGSYYIETLTDELASHAWEQFKVLEAKGGFIKCIESNFIQDMIYADAEHLKAEVKEGKRVLVGVNKFQNPKEPFKIKERASSGPQGKSAIKAIRPIRLSEPFEKEKASTQQATLNS